MKMKRSGTLLIKSIIYRPYSELVTFFIAWAITGRIKLSLAIGLADLVVKIFTYFMFDFFWDRYVKTKYSPCVIWLTGLCGAGKTSIANGLFDKFKANDSKCIVLDGDEVRKVFPTGFDKASRIKHNISVGEMAVLLEQQGYIVMVSLVSPFQEARDKIRAKAKKFIEVYVSTPLDVCEKRDVKGLYAKARRNEIKDFTGIDSPYEIPSSPEIIMDTSHRKLDECVNIIIKTLQKK